MDIWKLTVSGDDVKEKKPDPSIYLTAKKVNNSMVILLYCFGMKLYLLSLVRHVDGNYQFSYQKLGVSEKNCLVVEDSVIGLQVCCLHMLKVIVDL